MKRDTRTPTFWTSADPPPMLPRGQLDLPLVQAPRCEAPKLPRAMGFPIVCELPEGHTGPHGGQSWTWSR